VNRTEEEQIKEEGSSHNASGQRSATAIAIHNSNTEFLDDPERHNADIKQVSSRNKNYD
jgi:hypothetical protein